MGKSSGLNDTMSSEQSNASALVSLAQGQAANANTLFNESNPGMVQAENFNQTLASGDPYAISRAISPASQQISEATQGAKKNIMNNSPSGGEKNLALEQADVSQGAEVGKTATGSFLNSFNALSSLAGQGTGESISAAGTGISGFSSANSALGQIGSQQIQQKGAQLGALTSLGGDAATLGAAFL
jgi:hypothetical protein